VRRHDISTAGTFAGKERNGDPDQIAAARIEALVSDAGEQPIQANRTDNDRRTG
jgi:hypothetical protein